MNKFEEIISLKNSEEKKKKLSEYYKNNVKIDDWLNVSSNKSIINFKDRTEYKMFNKYHRINGPAIDYNDDKLNQYYYKGKKYENKEEWEKITIKELRKVKIKKLSNV